MSVSQIKLSHKAIGDILKGEGMRAHLMRVARPVASAASSHPALASYEGAEVVVESYTTDRAVVAIGISHEVGAGIEAKHRVIEGAARAAGLDVDRTGDRL